ncbi:cytochrome b/b6 domain-containing protein [Shewanella alkalitolerans]|uniref:cytochrome b/b6 domain-containing protein n=1 Tax=Shewanella alkalitolerans TaxID=2864209 RepID=UPI001C65B756|nr:cytochrome b/b6 domain-containing protein [Shewanella alkalitolerans]QYJ98313.1 cytochrome b/b6 domain-containing protein [Shewanella alkalitolerans]
MKTLTKLREVLETYQHLFVILLTLFLVGTSGWLMMGRALRANASVWDILHVYLGLLAGIFSVTMLAINLMRGQWRQYFPYLVGDFTQLSNDVCGLKRGKLPLAGGRGLFSVVEGIGMLLFVAVSVTGLMWFITQGSSEALNWRSYHHSLAHGFIVFMVIHALFALSHLLDFIRR